MRQVHPSISLRRTENESPLMALQMAGFPELAARRRPHPLRDESRPYADRDPFQPHRSRSCAIMPGRCAIMAAMRRLVVCCDGTWNTPDHVDAGARAPTNV